MADVSSLIPASVLRDLADKLYAKRKDAALQIGCIIKQLALSGEHDKISAVIDQLSLEFAYSPQANHRKGGLIGLAAATVNLGSDAARHLRQLVRPVLKSSNDPDPAVRYSACETLYTIAKVLSEDFIIFFKEIFDVICKLPTGSDSRVQNAVHILDGLVKDIVRESNESSIKELIPSLMERMDILNPYVQLLIQWTTIWRSSISDSLDGLFNMLNESCYEVRQHTKSALSELLQEILKKPPANVDYGSMIPILVQRAGSPDGLTRLTAITWINEFVKFGGEKLVPCYAEILGGILPCISDGEEDISSVAREINEKLRGIHADPADRCNKDADQAGKTN